MLNADLQKASPDPLEVPIDLLKTPSSDILYHRIKDGWIESDIRNNSES